LPPLAGGDQVADNEPAPVAVEVPE
jgi:hypothetical protein